MTPAGFGQLVYPPHQCYSVKQDGNNLACQCNHTYEFLHLTQLCYISAEVHNTKAWEPIYTHHHQCCSVKQDRDSRACQCNHTFEIWHLTQLCWIAAVIHSTTFWLAFCSRGAFFSRHVFTLPHKAASGAQCNVLCILCIRVVHDREVTAELCGMQLLIVNCTDAVNILLGLIAVHLC